MKFQQGSAFLLYNHCVNKKDEARAATRVSAPSEVSGSGAVGNLKPNRDAIVTGWPSLGMAKPGDGQAWGTGISTQIQSGGCHNM